MINQSPARAATRQVSLSDIEARPDVFQFQHFEVDPLHVDALAETPKGGFSLDPLTLWRDEAGGGLVVVDGHHRLAAYSQAGWTKKVPVRIHECSLQGTDRTRKSRQPNRPDAQMKPGNSSPG